MIPHLRLYTISVSNIQPPQKTKACSILTTVQLYFSTLGPSLLLQTDLSFIISDGWVFQQYFHDETVCLMVKPQARTNKHRKHMFVYLLGSAEHVDAVL